MKKILETETNSSVRLSAKPVFIRTPYENGVSLREDIFNRQFSVYVNGMTEYPEDDPIYGTYLRSETLSVCESSNITDAIAMLTAVHNDDRWQYRDEELNYHDDDLGHDCRPISFTPHRVYIQDRFGKRVLGGLVDEEINWLVPATSHSEVMLITERQRELRRKASYERGWDNSHEANLLEREADILELRVVGTRYMNMPEIIRVLEPPIDNEAKEHIVDPPPQHLDLFISGVIDAGGELERVDDEEAQFWTVYQREPSGLSYALFDCVAREDAETAMKLIASQPAPVLPMSEPLTEM